MRTLNEIFFLLYVESKEILKTVNLTSGLLIQLILKANLLTLNWQIQMSSGHLKLNRKFLIISKIQFC